MTRRLIHLIAAGTLALSGVAFTACSSDDRPESEDIERSVEDAAEGAEDAINEAAEETEQATE